MHFLTPLALHIEIGGLLGFMPYRWSWKKKQMIFRPSGVWKATHAIWFGVISVYAVFLIHQSYGVFTDPKATNLDRAKVIYMSTLHVGLDVGFMLDLQGWGEHHHVLNQLVSYAAKVKSKHGARINHKLVKWLLSVNLFAWIFVTSNALAVFRAPDSKRLLTSLMANPGGAARSVKIYFFCIHWVINSCQFYFLSFNSMMLICYNYLLVPIVDGLDFSEQKSQNRDQQQQRSLTPYQIQKHSIRLAILQSQYTSAYASWLLLIIVWSIVIIALNVFQVVAFQALRPLISSIMISSLLASICKSAGRVFERAQNAKNSWRSIRGVDWFSRFAKGYRPARVPLGSFFYFDRGIWPTIFNIILGQAANLIVSYREE